MLTAEQKQYYLEHRGVRCPFCHSQDIEGASVKIDAGSASQDITCLNKSCGRYWTDIYRLVDIEECESGKGG